MSAAAGHSSAGTDRATFLARVRRALSREPGQAIADPPRIEESIVRTGRPADDLVALFAQRATDAGMRVHRTPASEAPDRIVRILAEGRARSVASAEVGVLG